MDTLEAIELLDRLVSQVALNREDHSRVEMAIAVLKQATMKKEVKS